MAFIQLNKYYAAKRQKNQYLLAISLAFTAAGIILLYLLWGVKKIDGQTLNATTFYILTETWNYRRLFVLP